MSCASSVWHSVCMAVCPSLCMCVFVRLYSPLKRSPYAFPLWSFPGGLQIWMNGVSTAMLSVKSQLPAGHMILCGSLFKSANRPGKGKAAAVVNKELSDSFLFFSHFWMSSFDLSILHLCFHIISVVLCSCMVYLNGHISRQPQQACWRWFLWQNHVNWNGILRMHFLISSVIN